MRPFKNESEEAQIGNLVIENRLDHLTIYGRVEITKDREGLINATMLRAYIAAAIRVLQLLERDGKLPEHSDSPKDPMIKPNPFLQGE